MHILCLYLRLISVMITIHYDHCQLHWALLSLETISFVITNDHTIDRVYQWMVMSPFGDMPIHPYTRPTLYIGCCRLILQASKSINVGRSKVIQTSNLKKILSYICIVIIHSLSTSNLSLVEIEPEIKPYIHQHCHRIWINFTLAS